MEVSKKKSGAKQTLSERTGSASGTLRLDKLSQEPEQYQKGWVEFYKLKFKVTPDTLIPRPETELLVDEVIAYAKRSDHPEERISDQRPLTILDLGTGAGNIIISLAKNLGLHLKGVRLIATDISKQALTVAQQNTKLHGVSDKITFIQSDLLPTLNFHFNVRSHIEMAQPDIIVTNLPYIPSARIPYLDSSVKDFEPHLALDGGPDGFALYRKLFAQIRHRMTPKSRGVATNPPPGWKPKLILGEIDYTHGEIATAEAQKYFPQAKVEVKTDLAHKQRILKIEFTGPAGRTR